MDTGHRVAVASEREAGIGLFRVTMRCLDCGHEATAVTHPSRKQATIANANTEHHAALFRSTPPAPQQAAPPNTSATTSTASGSGDRRHRLSNPVKGLGGVVALLFILSGWGGLSRLQEHSSVSDLGDVASSQYDCDDLASDAVDNSSDGDAVVQLLKVRNPQVVKDNRDNYQLPSGDGEALILSCRGTGVWSSGGDSPVLLRDTVDADGDEWVEYRPVS
jgi:hypothetical protein